MTKTASYPPSRVRPEDMAMELKCVVVGPVLRFLEATFGRERMRQIVAETVMDPDHLADANNWVSFAYFCRLLDKLVEVTGDPMAPYVSAKLHTDRVSYKAVGIFLVHLCSPDTAYKLLEGFSFLWNRISEWKVTQLSRNSCRITLKYPAHKQCRNNCLAIQGSLATFPRQFGLPFAAVTQRECAAEGAEACVYDVSWVNKPSRLWGYTGALIALAVGAGMGWGLDWTSAAIGGIVAMVLVGYFAGREVDYKIRLSDVYAQNEAQASSLLESIRAIEELNEDLQQKVEQRTTELSEANRRLEKAFKDLQESQERIITAERQSAIGVLAAGMAHELNNPLNAIRLSLQALSEDLRSNAPLERVVETATRAADRCHRIVSDLLLFSREPQRAALATLPDIVAEAVNNFCQGHPDGIRIKMDIHPDMPTVQLDRAQIKQALANLLDNASDAMQGRGDVEVSLAPDDRHAVLSIADHGPGMDEVVRRRIFDPFFTTKKSATKKGIGLGLSISYQIVQRNGGTIEAHSRQGKGATFVIRFPLQSGGDSAKDTTHDHQVV